MKFNKPKLSKDNLFQEPSLLIAALIIFRINILKKVKLNRYAFR